MIAATPTQSPIALLKLKLWVAGTTAELEPACRAGGEAMGSSIGFRLRVSPQPAPKPIALALARLEKPEPRSCAQGPQLQLREAERAAPLGAAPLPINQDYRSDPVA